VGRVGRWRGEGRRGRTGGRERVVVHEEESPLRTEGGWKTIQAGGIEAQPPVNGGAADVATVRSSTTEGPERDQRSRVAETQYAPDWFTAYHPGPAEGRQWGVQPLAEDRSFDGEGGPLAGIPGWALACIRKVVTSGASPKSIEIESTGEKLRA